MALTDEQILDKINQARTGTPAWWTGPELEEVLTQLVLAKQRKDDLLSDFQVFADGAGQFDPATGANSITLPPAWAGKRIRVLRNGTKFYSYSRTASGIALTNPLDAVQPSENFDFENY